MSRNLRWWLAYPVNCAVLLLALLGKPTASPLCARWREAISAHCAPEVSRP